MENKNISKLEEAKIREFFVTHSEIVNSGYGDDTRYAAARIEGSLQLLSILGIKIEGVNA